MTLRAAVVTVLAAILLLPAPGSAQTPRGLEDLVGARAAGGETDLESRGWVHIKTQKSSDGAWSNWWNAPSRECITVATRDGRFAAITSTPAVDCNQRSDASDDVAAAAVLGAVVIGAIALSHGSHHHEGGSHLSDADDEREFERGHRDGLYDHSFDDYNDSRAYRDGYSSGVEQRDHDSSYRDHSGRYDRGYQPAPERNFSSLNGGRAADADRTLQQWGFRSVDSITRGTARYTIYYSRATGECLQATIADGRAEDVRDIGQHPACR